MENYHPVICCWAPMWGAIRNSILGAPRTPRHLHHSCFLGDIIFLPAVITPIVYFHPQVFSGTPSTWSPGYTWNPSCSGAWEMLLQFPASITQRGNLQGLGNWMIVSRNQEIHMNQWAGSDHRGFTRLQRLVIMVTQANNQSASILVHHWKSKCSGRDRDTSVKVAPWCLPNTSYRCTWSLMVKAKSKNSTRAEKPWLFTGYSLTCCVRTQHSEVYLLSWRESLQW